MNTTTNANAASVSGSKSNSSSIMRRQNKSSSSCLLLPKDSFDKDQQQELKRTESSSVTLISQETLPHYCAERFYLISEIESQTGTIQFLREMQQQHEQHHDESTQATEDSASTDADATDVGAADVTAASRHPSPTPPTLPEFILLYLLWKPDMTSNAEVFTDTVVLNAVQRLQEFTKIVSSCRKSSSGNCNNNESLPPPLSQELTISTTTTNQNTPNVTTTKKDFPTNPALPITGENGNNVAATTEGGSSNVISTMTTNHDYPPQPNQSSSVYLVVDRIFPTNASISETHSHSHNHSHSHSHADVHDARDEEDAALNQQAQVNLAEEFSRNVASHPLLRNLLEGITIGVSNHVRAAPGLEACVTAAAFGAKDRRIEGQRKSKNDATFANTANTSGIGVLADQPTDLIGLQSLDDTDAAQGIRQNRVCAEWNGQGHLQSFAMRAHSAWRTKNGLPILPLPITPRKSPRRRNNRTAKLSSSSQFSSSGGHRQDNNGTHQEQGWLFDAAILVGLLGFVMFHFSLEVRTSVWMLTTVDGMSELVQYLREL